MKKRQSSHGRTRKQISDLRAFLKEELNGLSSSIGDEVRNTVADLIDYLLYDIEKMLNVFCLRGYVETKGCLQGLKPLTSEEQTSYDAMAKAWEESPAFQAACISASSEVRSKFFAEKSQADYEKGTAEVFLFGSVPESVGRPSDNL